MKIFIISIFFALSLFSSTITSIKDNNIVEVDNLTNIKVGSSGLVFRDIQNNKIIISYAKVLKDNKIKLFKYTNLKQDSFPSFSTKVKVGDKIVWQPYKDRVLVIAPTKKGYIALSSDKNKEFIHPDILISLLLKDGAFNPKKSHFVSLCQEYSIGVLKFDIDNTLYDVDCISFDIISKQNHKTTKDKNIKSQLPFYNRINKVKKGIFNFETNMSSFNDYYKKLLGIK